MEPFKYDVFISYSRKDTSVADKIARAFEDAGISYFIDHLGIGGGMEFPAVLAKAIRESKVFLFLASKNSYESKFTQSEILYAFNKKHKQDIIPYIIDGSTLPEELEFTLSAINWRRLEQHPIETVLVNDVLHKVGKIKKDNGQKGAVGLAIQEQSQVSSGKKWSQLEKEERAREKGEDKIRLNTEVDKSHERGTDNKRKNERRTKSMTEIEESWNKRSRSSSKRPIKGRGLIPVSRQIHFLGIKIREELWGYADENDKVVIPFHWKKAQYFSEDLACVENEQGEWGFIDQAGTETIPCQWQAASNFKEGLAAVQNYKGKYGFIDKTGTVIIPCLWEDALNFSEGLASVKDVQGKWGFIDKTGTIVIPHQWENASCFYTGLARVMRDRDKWGVINKAGQEVIPCQWQEIGSFDDGLARVMKGQRGRAKWGYIDRLGKEVIPCQWREIGSFKDGLAYAQNEEGMYGYFDQTGNLVIPFRWRFARDFFMGLALVTNEQGKHCEIDKTGKVVKWM